MNRRDTDRRVDIAAQLLAALYAGDERPGQRAAVLDRITASEAGPVTAAGRALAVAYGTSSTDGQRAAVLDALALARDADPARRGFARLGLSRDSLLALASTLAAALIVGAVLLGVRGEGAPSPGARAAGLTAEAQRLMSATAQHPVGPGTPSPPPGVAGPGSTGAPPPVPPTVHPAIAAMQRGCDQGSAVTCRRLGTLYQRGRGVGANRPRAFELYDRACRAGDARGCTLRDAADRTLNDVDRDDRADAEYFSTLGL